MEICTECNNQITNPICAKCVVKSVEAWLIKNNTDLIDTFRLKAKIFNFLDDYNYGEIKCIKCNNPVNICLYCSSNEIYEWIKESDDKISAQTFPFKFEKIIY